MSHEWGVWNDPDTMRGMQQYTEAGLTLATPDQNRGLGQTALLELAQACGGMLEEMYRGTYPLGVGHAETLATSIATGETELFTLAFREEVISMAGIVHQRNQVGSSVHLAELGRACESPGYANGVSSRALLKYRVPWALDHTDVDFLYSFTRALGHSDHGLPSGKGVQSVWWGGRAYGTIPLVTTQAGWNYRLAGIEPFNGFVIPAKPLEWAAAVNQQAPLHVGRATDRAALEILLSEGTTGSVEPAITVSPQGAEEPVFYQLDPPSTRAAATYVIAQSTIASLSACSAQEVTEQRDKAISQRVVIEASVSQTPKGAATMEFLHADGWTLTGWQPSEETYGAVCPVFGRLNPARLADIQRPRHHPQYFDGLSLTRGVLETAYADMEREANRRYTEAKALVA